MPLSFLFSGFPLDLEPAPTWSAWVTLMVLMAGSSLLSGRRRSSLRALVQELRRMRLGDEPRQLLGRVLRAVGEILHVRHTILLFYDSEEEQLYRWDYRQGEAEPTPLEVPPHEVDFWITLDRREVAEALPAESPLCQRLEAQRILSVRFARGSHCGRLLVLDPKQMSAATLRGLQALAVELAPLIQQFFLLRRARALAIDEERSRIARDFHDGPLQTFLSIDLHLEFIRKLAERDPAGAAQQLEQLQLLVRNQAQEMRDLVEQMRPMDMEGTTLLGLLRGLVEQMARSGDISVQLLADSHRVQVPRRVSREVFQITRDAVANTRKHARASHIVIAVDAQAEELKLTIDDDGQGFNFSGSYTLEELDRLRVGPVSIKQRARQLGASLRLESHPGHGSRLLLRVPLASPKSSGVSEPGKTT